MCKLSVVSLKYKQAYPENKINNWNTIEMSHGHY